MIHNYYIMENFKISCKNLPKIFFENKDVAKNHFRQFGRIKRMIFKPKTKACTIEYATHDSVQRAIDLGCIYENHIFEIVKESPLPKRKRIKKEQDPDWVPDPDVLKELDGMGGGPSFGLEKKHVLRAPAMDIEIIEEKPKIVLKRQWPTIVEKKKSPKRNKPVVSTYKFTEEQIELIELLKKPTHSIDEKYKCLDARDKLLRFFIKRDGTKSGTTQGTCPDMCPEKERLLRVIQHQVSIYEQDLGKEMNPALAIKQYSRSSADQEASLPHELRPVDVLQMTMSYLVHKIMNLGDNSDVNIGDWFHFLWDRTRSIRKDITQQELCSRGSVSLVEQCARFHIHCSARLVAEEPSVFDQKINTENLTKCLQTLKYMYNDLQLKGEMCQNEAEFRAYIILLNLNDGNFMWEVQKLRPEIQKSHEVRNAIEVYSALNQNNFIKFFKLVKSSTYLNACILMRYFMQVRIRAMTILLKCYTPRITKVVYPVDKLTSNLAFESTGHTMEFLQSCRLSINASESAVILDKKMFSAPEFTYTSLDRSINVVESKRGECSVGQIVCGGSLPSKNFENYTPRNSFTSEGVLKINDYAELKNVVNMPIEKSSDKISKVSSKQSLFVSPKVKNPYVYVKDAQATNSPAKSFKTEIKDIAFQKSAPLFAPLKSSIFSLDNRKNQEKKTLKTNIFGGQVAQNLPTSETDDEKLKIVSGDTAKLSTADRPPETTLLPAGSKLLFGNTSESSKSIFDYTSKLVSSLLRDETDNQVKTSIFGGTQVKSGSTSLFQEVKEAKVPDSSIFGNNSTIFGNKSNALEKVEDPPKDKIDFQEIKWDLDSPEKGIGQQNIVEDVFFKPPSIQTGDVSKNIPKPLGGFSFPLGPIDGPANQTNIPIIIDLQKEQSESEKQKILQQQKKLEEEREQLEKEKKERIRKLEIECQMAQKKRKEEEERIRKLREEEHAKQMEKKRLEEIRIAVKKLIPEIVEKVEIHVRNEKLLELKRKIQKRLLVNMFQIWRKTAIKIKKKRKAIDCSPILICPRNPEEEAAELRTESQNLTLKYMKRYKLGEPSTLTFDERNIISKIDFKELSEILSKRYCELGMKFFKEIYWKCVISLPSLSEMAEGRGRIDQILQEFLQWKNSNEETILLDQHALNQVQSVKYCIEKQSALEIKSCDANGFIFVAQNYNQALCRRILENMKNFGIFVKIPIVIILQEEPPKSMNFKMLVEEGIISDYLILIDNFSAKKFVSNIEAGLRFLSKNVETPPPVQLDTMRAFLNRNLCTEVWKKANSFCKWNSVYKNCLRSPNIVIDLYNDALSKLKKIILNKSCYEFANFPTVFKELLPSEIPDCLPCDYKYFPPFCKEKSYLDLISNLLKNLELEPIKKWPPKDQIDLEFILSEFITKHFEVPEKPFYKTLAVFLKQIEASCDFKEIQNVLWTDIIEVLALEKMKQLKFSFEGTEYLNKSVFNQIVVIYNPEALCQYTNSDWFYVNNPIIKKHIEAYSYLPRREKENSYNVTNEEIDEAISKARSKIKDIDHTEIKNEMKEFDYLLSDLENSLLINKKIASNMNERFMTIVKDD